MTDPSKFASDAARLKSKIELMNDACKQINTMIIAASERLKRVEERLDERRTRNREFIDVLNDQKLDAEALENLKRWLPIFKNAANDPILKDAMDKILVFWELKYG